MTLDGSHSYVRASLLLAAISSIIAPQFALLEAQSGAPGNLGVPPNAAMFELPTSATTSGLSAEVNAANGNLHIEIPIRSIPQRGALDVRYTLEYDSATWFPQGTGLNTLWYGNPGWRVVIGGAWTWANNGYDIQNLECPGSGETFGSAGTYPEYGPFYFADASGSVHAVSLFTADPSACPYGGATDSPIASGYTLDGSGYFVSITSHTDADVYGPDGRLVFTSHRLTPGGQPVVMEDTNGNYLSTTGPNYDVLVDTAGRSLPYGLPSFGAAGPTFPGSNPPSAANPYVLTLPSAAGPASFQINLALIPVCTSFPGSLMVQYCTGNSTATGTATALLQINSLDLPDGRQFSFSYDSGTAPGHYGTLTGITLPNGGTLSFSFVASGGTEQPINPLQLHEAIVNGAIYDFAYAADTGTLIQTTTMTGAARFDAQSNTQVRDSTIWKTWFPNSAMVSVQSIDGATGAVVRTDSIGYPDQTYLHPTSFSTVWGSAGPTSTTQYTYIPGISVSSGSYGAATYAVDLPQSKRQWDYGVSTTATPTREERVSYDATAGLSAAHIIDHPESVKIFGLGTLLAETDYSYDGVAPSDVSGFNNVSAVGALNHDNVNYPASRTVGRGNLTATQRLVSSGQWLNSSQSFNLLGNLNAVTDARGYTTEFDWNDCLTATQWNSGCSSALGTFAYRSSTKNALGHMYSSTFNVADGSLQSTRDPNDVANSRMGTHYVYDNSGRMTDTYPPVPNGHVHLDYGSSLVPEVITATQTASPTPDLISSITLDGFGRPQKSVAPNQAIVDTVYNPNGSLARTSNPYLAPSDPTYGFTSYSYDSLGRKTYECHPDNGTGTSACVGGSSYVGFSYDANTTSTQDERENITQTTIDAFGRLTKVLDAANQQTSYSYDAAGNLLTVRQVGRGTTDVPRTRSFSYDALSRLLTSTNPETGTICFGTYSGTNCQSGYDANGNLQHKTDARGVTTNYDYDGLNRLTKRNYTGETAPNGSPSTHPTLSTCYLYDSDNNSGTNTVGRLVAEWTQPGSCPATSSSVPSNAVSWKDSMAYDAMGRLKNEKRCAFAPCAAGSPLQYMYDLAGNLTYTTNGLNGSQSPQIGWTNSFDSAGRLSSTVSTWDDATHPATLFKADAGVASALGVASAYSPFGGLAATQYGVDSTTNTFALSDVRSYDNRGRLTSKSVVGGTSSSTALQSTSITFAMTPSLFTAGESPQLSAHVSCNTACGDVVLTIDGHSWVPPYPLEGSGNSPSWWGIWPSVYLTAGTHTATVDYLGNSTYAPSTASVPFTIVPAGAQVSSISLSANPTVFTTAENAEVSVHVNCNAACVGGEVDLLIDGQPWLSGWRTDAGGNVNIDTYWWMDNTLPPGPHTFVADYLGDPTNAPSTTSIGFAIAPIGTQSAPISFQTPLGSTVSLSSGWHGTVSIPGYVNGFVDITVDGNPWWSGQLNHQGTTGNEESLDWISIGSGDSALFPPGAHTIRAHFRGNANYAPTDSDLVVMATP